MAHISLDFSAQSLRIARWLRQRWDIAKTGCNTCYYAQQTLSLHYIIVATMKFIDRIEESERLTKALARDTTSFVVGS